MDIPAYTPYTLQARHRAIESVLMSSAETLQIPDVALRLGQYTAALVTVIDRAIIPNIRNDEIVIDGSRTTGVPIIAVHVGERVLRRSKDLTFNPQQKYAINKKFKSRVAHDIFTYHEESYKNESELIEVPALSANTTIARVHVDHVVNDDGPWPMRLNSRPLVQFNLDAGQPLSPIIALHEFTHVMQYNNRPIERAVSSRLPLELEAYYVAAQAIQGYYDAGRQDELLYHTSQDRQDTALDVEAIRRRHNGPITEPKPFAYDCELIEELAINKLTITPSIAALVDMQTQATT